MEPAAGGRYSAGAAGAPGSRGPCGVERVRQRIQLAPGPSDGASARNGHAARSGRRAPRSEEHTSELQSRLHLVCRLLLEKKKINISAVCTQRLQQYSTE